MIRMSRRLLITLCLTTLAGVAHAGPPLRLGTNVWPGYEPLYLAAHRENWESRLNVRLVEFASASEVLRAFRNGLLEAAALTLDEALQLLEAGLPVRVVLVLDVSHGGDVVLGRPELTGFRELRQRRVGVESGALGAFMLARALEIHGMTVSDVELVHLDGGSHESVYRDGTVDAVVTFEPMRTRLLSQGARVLFSSEQIPGEIVDVLVVRESLLATRETELRGVVAGWFRTLAHMDESPQAAAAFTATRLRISEAEVLASYRGLRLPDEAENRRMLTGQLQETLQRLSAVLHTHRLLHAPVDVGDLLTPALLPRCSR